MPSPERAENLFQPDALPREIFLPKESWMDRQQQIEFAIIALQFIYAGFLHQILPEVVSLPSCIQAIEALLIDFPVEGNAESKGSKHGHYINVFIPQITRKEMTAFTQPEIGGDYAHLARSGVKTATHVGLLVDGITDHANPDSDKLLAQTLQKLFPKLLRRYDNRTRIITGGGAGSRLEYLHYWASEVVINDQTSPEQYKMLRLLHELNQQLLEHPQNKGRIFKGTGALWVWDDPYLTIDSWGDGQAVLVLKHDDGIGLIPLTNDMTVQAIDQWTVNASQVANSTLLDLPTRRQLEEGKNMFIKNTYSTKFDKLIGVLGHDRNLHLHMQHKRYRLEKEQRWTVLVYDDGLSVAAKWLNVPPWLLVYALQYCSVHNYSNMEQIQLLGGYTAAQLFKGIFLTDQEVRSKIDDISYQAFSNWTENSFDPRFGPLMRKIDRLLRFRESPYRDHALRMSDILEPVIKGLTMIKKHKRTDYQDLLRMMNSQDGLIPDS